MKKITLEFRQSRQELSAVDLKQERVATLYSGNFPMDAPCKMEIDCGDGRAPLTCETNTAGETCTYLVAGALGHEEPIGIKCGSTIKQCNNEGSGFKVD